jgi:hypothetical protein
LRIVFLEALDPLVRQPELAGVRQGLHIELGLEGVQRPAADHHAEHLRDQFCRDAAVDLFEFALRFEGKTRPQGQHIALFVRQHAVVVARGIDEAHRLQIAVAEAQRA